MPKVKGVYKDGLRVVSPLRTWSDDFSFATLGIPALRNDFQDSKYMQTHYHTQFDNEETYNEKALRYHQNLYGLLGIYHDQTARLPLDFSERFKALKASLKSDSDMAPKDQYQSLIQKLDQANKTAQKVAKKAKAINKDYQILKAKNPEKASQLMADQVSQNQELLAIFKKAESQLVKLTWEDEPIFAHEHSQNNIQALEKARDLLQKGKAQEALDQELYKVDNNWYAYDFDKEVYNYFTDYVLKPGKEKLLWGTGKIVSHRDLYDLIASLKGKANNKSKDFKDEIAVIDQAIADEKAVLKVSLTQEMEVIASLEAELNKIN
ncbi:hypothetical protein ACVRY7_04665 [Streptococcus ictaluri]|uniref:Uncharacterized protein n=1 Tax=Streptococcus ictaluri 707-05 TaxID=764299 RepID=G5K1I0_9STRE|nr:hypothetical protein [Streptococcus ictaluri]EHI70026.1 hypothetical protein STRIC_2238 [Streptococcus ictaluri 707-05]